VTASLADTNIITYLTYNDNVPALGVDHQLEVHFINVGSAEGLAAPSGCNKQTTYVIGVDDVSYHIQDYAAAMYRLDRSIMVEGTVILLPPPLPPFPLVRKILPRRTLQILHQNLPYSPIFIAFQPKPIQKLPERLLFAYDQAFIHVNPLDAFGSLA